MSNQIVISSGAKVRNLDGVLTGTSGIVNSVPLGAANGVATLDSGGKVPVSQLPSSVVTYLGTWNAATNTPTLVNGTGDAGDMYICNVAGTVNFGAGPVTFAVGDWVLYGSGTWQKSNGQNGTVTSVGVSRDGDALSITGSPITTAGTINIGFTGSNGQYINGEGDLVTFPSLSGYVPYTGATANLDLGTFDLTTDIINLNQLKAIGSGGLNIYSNSGTHIALMGGGGGAGTTFYGGIIGTTASFASSGGSDTFAINHSSGSGIALNITKGGNGEGLYINKTSGSGNAATIIGTLNATTLVKSGGTSSQFLKADGSVDSSTYLTTSAAASTYLPLTGGTLTGPLNGTSANFSGKVTINATLSAWMSAFSVIQLGALTAIWNSDINFSGYGNNIYYNGSFYKYLTSSFANKFELGDGVFTWDGAPSGTAGDNVVFTQYMRLDASGNLGLRTSTIGSRLQINGNAAIGYSASTAAPTNGLAVAGQVNFASALSGTSGNFTVNDAATNSVLDILTLTHTTSGTAASGLGAGILFRAERPSSGIVLSRGAIYGVSGTDPDDNGDLAFYTLTNTGGSGFSEKMRIKGNGNVLINKTTDDGYPLQVNGTISVIGTYGLSKINTGAFFPILMNGSLYYVPVYA